MAEASKDDQRREMPLVREEKGRDGSVHWLWRGNGVRISEERRKREFQEERRTRKFQEGRRARAGEKLTKAAPPWDCHKVGAVGLVPQTLNLYL